jgi:hypothetical protein
MTRIGGLAITGFEVADAVYQKLNDAKDELELEDVWYGPQELIPRYPCVVVEPRPKRRQLNGTHRWDLSFIVVISLYHGKVQTVDLTRLENEEHAVMIEEFIHQDLSLGGKVLLGYVTLSEPGITRRSDTMVVATRMTWEGDSREGF